jgi:Tfp pilus assembly protein PilW
MPVKRRLDVIRDQRGTTMVEVLVSTTTGLVVLFALTIVIVVSMHGTARVSARVDATQRARLVVTTIMQQLHSACVAPKIAPIQPGSTGTTLRFIHARASEGSAVAPSPILTEISLSGGVLTQTDWASTGGSAPTWTYSSTSTTKQLLTGVGPIAPSSSIFSYYASSNGSVSPAPQSTPLETGTALLTIQVRVALSASPSRNTTISDKNAAASIQNSATLRLTPPSFNEAAASLPCQ